MIFYHEVRAVVKRIARIFKIVLYCVYSMRLPNDVDLYILFLYNDFGELLYHSMGTPRKAQSDNGFGYSDIDNLKFILRLLYERDNDDLAWTLIERFGSVPDLFHASYYELMQIDGVTDRVASFFSSMLPIQRQALLRSAQAIKLDCEDILVKYIMSFGIGFIEPFDMCIFLDKHDRFIFADRLIEEERFREIVMQTCRTRAAKVVIARYIPFASEEPIMPSVVRIRSLIKLINVFDAMNVEFADYFAYTPFEFFGLRRFLRSGERSVHASAADGSLYMIDGNILERLNDYHESVTGERVDLF